MKVDTQNNDKITFDSKEFISTNNKAVYEAWWQIHHPGLNLYNSVLKNNNCKTPADFYDYLSDAWAETMFNDEGTMLMNAAQLLFQ